MPSAFDKAFAFVVLKEGSKLSLDPDDPGNYTPDGRLVGSKFGISAKSYPNEDIPNMTVARAAFLAKRDFWDVNQCDAYPPPLSLLMLDAAYNQGVADAARFLQRALSVTDDGHIGVKTVTAVLNWVSSGSLIGLAKRFTTQRIVDYSDAKGWPKYRVGWTGRAIDALYEAIQW